MSTIKIKRSGTGGQAPTAGNLVSGELALNYADGKLFIKDASNNVKEMVGPNMFSDLPTSDPAVAGSLWNDAGTVKISAG
jgi:hypothetical protein